MDRARLADELAVIMLLAFPWLGLASRHHVIFGCLEARGRETLIICCTDALITITTAIIAVITTATTSIRVISL